MKPITFLGALVMVVAAACSSSHAKVAAATTTTGSSSTTVAAGTTTPLARSTTTTAVSAGGALPAGFAVTDMTWISANQGWAIGAAPCGHPPCTSVVHTLDGGHSWAGLPAPKAYLEVNPQAAPPSAPCSATVACVHGIRFADANTGYAFGATSLWLTTNGGHTWSQKGTDASDALEVSHGTVVRVTHTGFGCPPGCPYQVETSAVGSTTWHHLAAPSLMGISATLAVEGANIYAGARGHVAGGATDAHTGFARSNDGGVHWSAFADPCGTTVSGSEADAAAITAAPGGYAVVACNPRAANEVAFVVVSADAAVTFGPHRGNLLGAVPPGGDAIVQIAAASGQQLAVLVGGFSADSTTSIAVSNDAGVDWTVTHSDIPPNGPASEPYLGFQDSLNGRAVINPRTVLTTTDGGGHWSGFTFP